MNKNSPPPILVNNARLVIRDSCIEIMNKILKKIIWLLLYLAFNISLFFIEIIFIFKKNDTIYTSNTGFNSLDDLVTISNSAFNFLGELALVSFSFIAMGLALIAFLLFIPVYIYFIKPKYKNHKKRFLFSLLASFVVVIVLKLILYTWMFIDLNYL
ncbi:hypothetical protein H0I23_11080 [Cellulophaga sp. HaHaR_3_176]|nr:hypothetical protein H0I23_11080 [Cellulophaga sp. HaHaR_3_176]